MINSINSLKQNLSFDGLKIRKTGIKEKIISKTSESKDLKLLEKLTGKVKKGKGKDPDYKDSNFRDGAETADIFIGNTEVYIKKHPCTMEECVITDKDRIGVSLIKTSSKHKKGQKIYYISQEIIDNNKKIRKAVNNLIEAIKNRPDAKYSGSCYK